MIHIYSIIDELITAERMMREFSRQAFNDCAITHTLNRKAITPNGKHHPQRLNDRNRNAHSHRNARVSNRRSRWR
ncbi:hypothetical protein [Glutamicibacter sp. BW80]|uniref:hypothetical protein n=1 Tax=Glutamicibacter sp. BW80 TaxID=2024404 RepID=UPI001142B9DD|nr:hypothetical protein [Glutamicibacter sp. BW80]